MLYLLANQSCQCFRSVIDNIYYILTKNGIPVIKMQHYNYDDDSSNDLWIVIWNSLTRLPRRCIVYNLDPLVPTIKDMFLKLVDRSPGSKIVQFIDYCYGDNYQAIQSLNLPYIVIPYGYSSYYEYLNSKYIDTPPVKDIDVLFYGNVNGRRKELLNRVNDMCKEKSYVMKICNNSIYGDNEKISTIAKSKIIISIASSDAKTIRTNDLARLSQLISTGGFAITEYIGDNVVEGIMDKYVPHFNTEDELLDYVDYYLTNTNERLEMIAKASNLFTIDFNFEELFTKNLSVEQYNCYSCYRSILVLCNNTCKSMESDYLDYRHCLLRGLKDNHVKIYTNMNSDLLTDEDEFITSKQDIIDAGKLVNFIILVSDSYPANNPPINLEGHHNYILDINRKNLTTYIDVSDDGNIDNVINSEYIQHCKCYLKRECTSEMIKNGFIPFPLTYFPIDTEMNDYPPKDIDIFCSFSQKHTGYRLELIKMCEKLSLEGYKVVIKDDCNKEEYYNLIRRSYITLDSKGYGEINHRFLEIISNRSVCCRQKYNVTFYRDYTPNEMLIEYENVDDAYILLKNNLKDKNYLNTMIEKSFNHYSKYHTPLKIADYACRMIMSENL